MDCSSNNLIELSLNRRKSDWILYPGTKTLDYQYESNIQSFSPLTMLSIFHDYNLTYSSVSVIFLLIALLSLNVTVKNSLTIPQMKTWTLMVLVPLSTLNLTGMVPYSWPVCVYPVMSGLLASWMWLLFTLLYIMLFKSSSSLLSHSKLMPSGTPSQLWGILPVLEMVSSYVRPLVLVARMGANLLCGHILIILSSKGIWSTSIIVLLILVPYEMMVGLLQATVFTMLLSVYYSQRS